MFRRLALAAAVSVASFGAVPLTQASAATLTVNSNADLPDLSPGNGVCATSTGVCTLRAAVQEANALAGTDTIIVPAMTISVGSLLTLSSNVSIQGAGARQTVLTASGSHGMLSVTGSTVSVSGLTITGATGGVGALAVNQSGGALTLDRIRVTGNIATGTGATYGPVYSQGGTLTLTNSSVTGNSTSSSLTNAYGGALSIFSATVNVVNSTLADNTLTAAGQVQGGGIWAGQNSSVTVTASTIAGNALVASTKFGSAIHQNNGGSGSVEVSQSILGDPVGATNCTAGGKMATFQGRNVLSDNSCGSQSAERTVADPLLGSLAANGGSTDTRVPAAGSPALNAASACASATDQRGQSRPIGSACDLGATELGSDRAVTVSASNTTPTANSDIVLSAKARNNGLDTSTGTTVTINAAGAAKVLSATTLGGSCSIADLTVTCPVGTLPDATTAEVLVTVRVPASGSVTTTATVDGQQPDPVAANNSAQAVANVQSTLAPPGGGTTGGACVVVRVGTAKADVLNGTAAGDRISGKGGNDRLDGKAGVDCLNGGPANDRIVGGPGSDKLSGAGGNDTILAKDKTKDTVVCGPGRDKVTADRKDKVSRTCESVRRR